MVRIVDMTSQPMSRISAMAMLGRATLSFLCFLLKFGAPLLDMDLHTRQLLLPGAIVRHALNEHTLTQVLLAWAY